MIKDFFQKFNIKEAIQIIHDSIDGRGGLKSAQEVYVFFEWAQRKMGKRHISGVEECARRKLKIYYYLFIYYLLFIIIYYIYYK